MCIDILFNKWKLCLKKRERSSLQTILIIYVRSKSVGRHSRKTLINRSQDTCIIIWRATLKTRQSWHRERQYTLMTANHFNVWFHQTKIDEICWLTASWIESTSPSTGDKYPNIGSSLTNTLIIQRHILYLTDLSAEVAPTSPTHLVSTLIKAFGSTKEDCHF